MRYPTVIALKAADHTYVRCGTGGKAWSCWGGKTGGTALTSGIGSTKRADAIAEPDECAGIACYLINGVCHQAANRILFPTGRTVMEARGYWVSEAIYGPYGRLRGTGGKCSAPFRTHPNVSGDLSTCAQPELAMPLSMASGSVSDEFPKDERIKHYYSRVAAMYETIGGSDQAFLSPPDLTAFHVALFKEMVKFRLGNRAGEKVLKMAGEARRTAEEVRLSIEDAFGHAVLKPLEFVAEVDRATMSFQDALIERLSDKDYYDLFGLEKGASIVLSDPEIVKKVF